MIRIQKDHVIVSRRGREFGIGYKVLIGADGPMSSVARSCGLEQKEFLVTLQCTVPLRRESEYAEIIFLEELFGGYAWLFPRRMDAVVGVGLRRRPGQRLDLKKHLERILDRYTGSGMIEAKPLEWTSGLVPVSGPGIILRENVLLAGDAAGHTHPITGAGIAPAVVSGNLAGDLAAQYVLTGDPALLQQYEVFWKMRFQKELLRAVARRKLLESSWDDLSAVLCQCWPAFPGYYAKNN